MEDKYQRAMKRFDEVYNPMRKKYNLRSHICTSLYDDALIEVWEYHGEMKGKCICRVKEKESIDCYERATEHLKQYAEMRERQERRAGAAMAG